MAFAGMNWLAICVAAIASFLFGALWYGLLGKQWSAALGKSPEDFKGPSPLPFIISAISLFVMAWVLAGVIGHLGPGHVTLRSGLISAAFVWVGFVATVLATNNGFQGAKMSLTLIDAGHWLCVLLIQGAIIGLFGV
jgi:Protein of unknown function (DUF1761)